MQLTKDEKKKVRLIVEAYIIHRTGLIPTIMQKVEEAGKLRKKGKGSDKFCGGFKDPIFDEMNKLEWVLIGRAIQEAIPSRVLLNVYFDFIGVGVKNVLVKRKRIINEDEPVLTKPITKVMSFLHIKQAQAYNIIDEWEKRIEDNLMDERRIGRVMVERFLKIKQMEIF